MQVQKDNRKRDMDKGVKSLPQNSVNRNRVIIIIFLILAALLLSVILWYRQLSGKTQWKSGQFFIMNTVVEYALYGGNAKEAGPEIMRQLRDYENQVSLYLNDSEIARINQAAGVAPVAVSARTMSTLKTVKNYCSLSGGLFDVTVAPLVEAWGITTDHPQVPDQATIDKLRQLIHYQDILLDEEKQTVMLAKKGEAIDLGGIAKGMADTIVRDVCAKYEVSGGYVSLGGNIITMGKKPNGKPFAFGVKDPRGKPTDYILSLELEDMSMATSGDYERYFEKDGKRYHHIFDPRTGYPADSDLISVSVIAKDGGLCDYLSTTLFIAGKQNSMALLDRQDFSLILVDQAKNVYVSDALRGKVKIHDPAGIYTFHIN